MLPRIITTEINPTASKGTLKGGLLDLVERMHSAVPVELDCISKEEWLDLRRGGIAAADGNGADSILQTEEETTLMKREAAPSARIPREVPALPKGYVPRKAILEGIKKMLFSLTNKENSNALENAMLLVQGMGGAGKTVVATSILHGDILSCGSFCA